MTHEKNLKQIWLAGGCFWGLEKYVSMLYGVEEAESGYANGHIENPCYRQVCAGDTGFAEAVRVKYDASVLPLGRLLDFFYEAIDPTLLNRQGGDVGEQYRTGVYYSDEKDEAIIQESLNRLAEKYKDAIVVECLPLQNFYPAEEYHQRYLEKNPGGYCHVPSALFNFAADTKKYQKPDEGELRESLSPLQYAVTQENGTEPPVNNEYVNEFSEGIYVDIASGEPLFVSSDKFESGCGWPAFSRPIDPLRLSYAEDTSHGMNRQEVRSRIADSHLGHVFNDGPEAQGGLRYCINSAALRFVPKDKMQSEGYGAYLPLVKNKK